MFPRYGFEQKQRPKRQQRRRQLHDEGDDDPASRPRSSNSSASPVSSLEGSRNHHDRGRQRVEVAAESADSVSYDGEEDDDGAGASSGDDFNGEEDSLTAAGTANVVVVGARPGLAGKAPSSHRQTVAGKHDADSIGNRSSSSPPPLPPPGFVRAELRWPKRSTSELGYYRQQQTPSPSASTSPPLQSHSVKQLNKLLALRSPPVANLSQSESQVYAADAIESSNSSRLYHQARKKKPRRGLNRYYSGSQLIKSLSTNSLIFSYYTRKYAREKFFLALRTFKRWYHEQLTYNHLSKRMEFNQYLFDRWYKSKGKPLSLRSLDRYDQIVIWIAGKF